MSYSLHQEISVASGSISALSRNLTATSTLQKGFVHAAVVHKQQVNVVGWDPRMEGMTQDMLPIKDPGSLQTGPASTKCFTALQAKYLQTPGRSTPMLAVCTVAGFVVYEGNGSTVYLWFPLSAGDPGARYTLGIALIGDHICVGTHTGDVLVFSAKNTSVKHKLTLSEHKVGIVDVVAGRELLATVSHDGVIVAYDANLRLKNKISTGQAPSCLSVYKEFVILGTVLGSILVYNAISGELACEIAAHARCVHALDCAQETGLLLSVSEDSFARVFRLKPDKEQQLEVESVYSESVKNVALFGGCFTDARGENFIVGGYDYPSIFYFKGAAKSGSK